MNMPRIYSLLGYHLSGYTPQISVKYVRGMQIVNTLSHMLETRGDGRIRTRLIRSTWGLYIVNPPNATELSLIFLSP